MKRSIATTMISLILGSPSLSFALDHMDLYTKPIRKSEVRVR